MLFFSLLYGCKGSEYEYRVDLIRVILGGEPTSAIIDEHDMVMNSILVPLYPIVNLRVPKPTPSEIIIYFHDNGFEEELAKLNEIYLTYIHVSNNARDQRSKTKNIRVEYRKIMEERLMMLNTVISVVHKYCITNQEEWIISHEDERVLHDFIRLRDQPMIRRNLVESKVPLS